MSSRIIILNGVSSAGKSTLARAAQQEADTTFLHVEMDAFISFLPAGHEFKPDWFGVDMIATEFGQLPRISNGPRGNALLGVMRKFVVDAAQDGLDLIVDEVCHAKEIDDYRSGLREHDVHFVKVFAPIETIEKREKARGDRLVGLAREQSGHLHNGIEYDLKLDTSELRPEACAQRIIDRLRP